MATGDRNRKSESLSTTVRRTTCTCIHSILNNERCIFTSTNDTKDKWPLGNGTCELKKKVVCSKLCTSYYTFKSLISSGSSVLVGMKLQCKLLVLLLELSLSGFSCHSEDIIVVLAAENPGEKEKEGKEGGWEGRMEGRREEGRGEGEMGERMEGGEEGREGEGGIEGGRDRGIEGGSDKGRKEGREGESGKEGGREGGRKEGREGESRKEGGREGRREGGREESRRDM